MSVSAEKRVRDIEVTPLTGKEQERLRRLYEPVEQDLLRIAATMLRFVPLQEAEDAAQEAFMSFARWALRGRLQCLGCRRLSDIDDADLDRCMSHCHAFLKCLVARQCHNFCRQATYRPRIRGGWVGDLEGRDSDPDSELIQEEEMICMRRAIMRLPNHLYEVVVLRFYGECSIEEIATALSIPVGTVKSRMHHLKRQLRALLPRDVGGGLCHP